MKWAYHNEFDPHAAQWTRNLMAAGIIPDGEVDERNLWDVHPDDLKGFCHVHFCSGIAVWAYALRQAGWADDRPVWSASLPCQPFSQAGKGLGFSDERHLWPAAYHLIRALDPGTIVGEQVASKDGLTWLDLVQDDMEGADYAFGALDSCAASVGAHHIRQRLYWLADSELAHHRCETEPADHGQPQTDGSTDRPGGRCCAPCRLADAERGGQCGGDQRGPGARGPEVAQQKDRSGAPDEPRHGCAHAAPGCTLDDAQPLRRGPGRRGHHGPDDRVLAHAAGADGRLGHAGAPGLPLPEPAVLQGPGRPGQGRAAEQSGRAFWADTVWLPCRDGKFRPAQRGSFPLASRLPASMGRLQPELQRLAALAGLDGPSLKRARNNRVARLRGYGNALCAPQAIAWVQVCMDELARRQP